VHGVGACHWSDPMPVTTVSVAASARSRSASTVASVMAAAFQSTAGREPVLANPGCAYPAAGKPGPYLHAKASYPERLVRGAWVARADPLRFLGATMAVSAGSKAAENK
jgi:hypothetical protein